MRKKEGGENKNGKKGKKEREGEGEAEAKKKEKKKVRFEILAEWKATPIKKKNDQWRKWMGGVFSKGDPD